MTKFFGTREAAGILGMSPNALQRKVWERRVDEPQRGPGGVFLWTEDDIRRAAWRLQHRELPADLKAAVRPGHTEQVPPGRSDPDARC
jgi:hypothetical protein